MKGWRPHRLATLFGEVRVKLPRLVCAGGGCGETGGGWPSHCRSTPELDQLQARLSALMPYRVAADVLRLPIDAGRSPETLRSHTLQVGRRLGDAAAEKPPAAGAAITISLNLTFIRSREDGERHLEVRVGNVETVDGGLQVFGAVTGAEVDITVLIRRTLETLGRTDTTEVTAFTDGCPGLRTVLLDAGVTKPPILDCWGGRPHGIEVPELGCQKPRPEPSMSHITRIGIDTSKAVFTLHCVDDTGRAVLQTNLRRAQMVAFFKKLPPTEIVMEACGSSHHWGRELSALGHDVRLIPPQYVKPFVKRAKNDRNDAEAICEAGGRPGMRFVPVKSAEQQAQAMVLKVRETLIGQRTSLANSLRGHAAEFGMIAGKGIKQIIPLLEVIEADTAIPAEAREMLALLGREIEHLDTRLAEIEVELIAMHKTNPLSQLLATIPGIGVIIALTFAIEIDPAVFKSGRHLAAWIGLTPKEHSTGGKQRLGGISRAGNERLRRLLVTGATAVIRLATRPGNKQANEWLLKLLVMSKSQQMRWSRDGADLLLQVRCAVYSGTLGAGFGHRSDRIAKADPAFAQPA